MWTCRDHLLVDCGPVSLAQQLARSNQPCCARADDALHATLRSISSLSSAHKIMKSNAMSRCQAACMLYEAMH